MSVYIDQSDQHLLHHPLSPSHAAPAVIITTGRMLSLSMALPPNRIAVTAAIVMMFTNAFMLYSSITHSCFLYVVMRLLYALTSDCVLST